MRAVAGERPVWALSHVPEPLWPRGDDVRLPAEPGALPADLEGTVVPYWNLPGLRSRSLARGYLRALEAVVRRGAGARALLTYNDTPWNAAMGRAAQRRLGIPWIAVVADAPGEGPAFERHSSRIAHAAGRVFLSWGRYRDASPGPALHLDGGVNRLAADFGAAPKEGPRAFLFAGSMNRWAGSSQAVRAFETLPHGDVELWLCGPGENPDVAAAAARDPRIKPLGFLDEATLSVTFQRASYYLNPRPASLADNRSNFPSKVLDYLSRGRPVVSTWTDGLAPDYRDVLVVAGSAEPAELARAMERALAMDGEERAALATRIRDFLLPGRLWSTQARRLLEWIEAEIPDPGAGA